MSQFIFRVLWLIWSKHSSFFFEFPVRKQFPFVLLQAKAVGFKYPPLENIATLLVSISSPSGEGGGLSPDKRQISIKANKLVSISSPSGEGGEDILDTATSTVFEQGFPLVLLQAKAVRVAEPPFFPLLLL